MAESLFLFKALAIVRGLHLLRGAGGTLGHLDLRQVAFAAAHIVAAFTDVTGNTHIFHFNHLFDSRMLH